MNMQPIDTAPKDRIISCYCHGQWHDALWSDRFQRFHFTGVSNAPEPIYLSAPTHWKEQDPSPAEWAQIQGAYRFLKAVGVTKLKLVVTDDLGVEAEYASNGVTRGAPLSALPALAESLGWEG